MTKPADSKKESPRDERIKLDMDPEEALKRLLNTPPARPAPKK